MGYQRVQLKMAAKQAMKFQRPHPMLITLLFILISGIGSRVISWLLGSLSGSNTISSTYLQALVAYEDPETAINYVLFSFGPQRLIQALLVGAFLAGIISSLWMSLLHTGYSGFCLGMVRGQQPQTGALFSAFPKWAGILLTQFLVGLFRILWGLLFGVCAGLLIGIIALTVSSAVGLALILILAVYVAVIVGIIWITLRYALVDFVIADQGLTGMDAIRESTRLMQGNIGKLFSLRLSFFGWYLLEAAASLIIVVIGLAIFGSLMAGQLDSMVLIAGGALIFLVLGLAISIVLGIINLWLTPYITGTEALFYDWTRGVDSTRPVVGPGGGQGGWGQPYPPQQHTSYTWTPTSGPTSGTGIGPNSQNGGTPQPPQPPQQQYRYDQGTGAGSDTYNSSDAPKPPKDDPWE